MSNDLTNDIVGQFADIDLQIQDDGRTYHATVGEDLFRFTRKTARKRSSMLLKLAPATKLVASVFSALRGQLTDGFDVDALTDADKMGFAAKAMEAIGDSLGDIDEEKFDILIAELVSWCDWKNPAVGRFEPMVGTAYEAVLDRNLFAQIPILVGVVQANFLASSSSSPSV